MRILLLALLLVACCRGAIIASRMEGRYPTQDIHVARLVVGTPGHTLRLALDFSDRYIRVARPMNSATYSHTAGGTDVIQVGRRRLRLPVRVDPEAAANLGCSSCDGTLGVGSASPLWLFYGSASFTRGSVLLDYGVPSPISATIGGHCQCLGPHPTLCMTEAEVHGDRYRVDLSFRTAETLVPMPVYERFVGLRSVGRDPSSHWDPLQIHFLAADGGPGTEVSIAAHNLVVMEKNSVRRLMVGLSPQNDTIYLGRTAWGSIMVYRNFVRGTAKIVQFDTRKHRTVAPLILLNVLSLIFIHWKLTRDGMLPSPDGVPRARLYQDRSVLEILGSGLTIVVYYLPPIREAVRISPTFDAYVFFGTATMLTWEALAVAMYWWDAGAVLGEIYVRKPKAEPPAKPKGGIPSSHNPAERRRTTVVSRRRRLASPFTITGATWRDIQPLPPRRRPRIVAIERSHFPVRCRLALIREVAHEIVLLLGILILSTETRTDSFAVALAAIFSLILTFFLIYNFLMAVYHLFGYDRQGLWILFLGTLLILLVTTVVLTFGQVVRPYLERRLFSSTWLVDTFTIILYGTVVLVASSVAEAEIRKERKYFQTLRIERLVPAIPRSPYLF